MCISEDFIKEISIITPAGEINWGLVKSSYLLFVQQYPDVSQHVASEIKNLNLPEHPRINGGSAMASLLCPIVLNRKNYIWEGV